MARIGPLHLRLTETWKYALVGGIASLPLTIDLYWQSGMGGEFSLNTVFFGGLLADYLASAAATETNNYSVGFRAGVVGGLPGCGSWWICSVQRSRGPVRSGCVSLQC